MGGGGRRRTVVLLAMTGMVGASGAGAGPLAWGPNLRRGIVAPGACPAGVPENPAADLRLVWVDLAGVTRLSFPSAEREVLSLLGRMGLRATIRQGDVRGTSDGSELTVIVLPGAPRGGRLEHGVMGATQRSREGVRAMWVYASGVGATLGLDVRAGSFWSLAERRQFGTAIGRVVVHEIVHALAPQRPHARGGLMAARIGRAQLVRPRLDIDASTVKAVRQALAGTPAAPGAVAGLP